MTPEILVPLAREAFTLTLMLAAPALCAGLFVGLIMSVFQAVTQLNEMTLAFVPKIIAIIIAMAVAMPWSLMTITEFTQKMIQSLPEVVR